tara:strand:- start:2117 stop:3331 length:1215 start_codon:yes stop_codon:yes gene_type:complete
MGGKSKAKSPDLKGAAEVDYQRDLDMYRNQSYANRADQFGPEGSLKWTTSQDIDPATGEAVTRWAQTTELSPELQTLYDSDLFARQNKSDVAGIATGRLKDEYADPMDWSGTQDWGNPTDANANLTTPGGAIDPRYTAPEDSVMSQYTSAIGDQVGDPNEFRQAGEDASYESQMRRVTPAYERNKASLEVKLRNQGLNPDDRVYQNQMRALSDSYNDASQSARLTAAGEGRQESSLNFGQQLDRNRNIFDQDLTANAQNYGMDASNSDRNFGQRLNANAQNYGMDSSSNAQNFGQRLQADNQAAGRSDTQFAQANALRGQQMNEKLTQRGFGLNEANAMMSGQQVNMPSFGSYNTLGDGPASNTMEAGINQSNFDQAQSQGFWSGLGGLANTGIDAFSAYKKYQ